MIDLEKHVESEVNENIPMMSGDIAWSSETLDNKNEIVGE